MDSSEYETDREVNNSKTSRVLGKSKKSYEHRFCDSWLNNKDFRPWLAPSKKSIKHFYCKVCLEDNKGGVSAVKKHMSTLKHQRAANAISNTHSIGDMNKLFSTSTTIEKKTKEAELRIAMFVIEHNFSFNSTDHLVQLLKSISPEVISKVSCNRTKATAIVKNVLGATGFENLVTKIKNQKFTMIIDESTDKSATKHLAVVVRLLDFNVYEVRDEFLCLIDISDGSALGVYNTIKQFFSEHSIPFEKNLVGFAADGASAMFGSKHSVKVLFENDIPYLYSMKCICHSLALVASYATQKIPDSIEKLVREIYTYFMYSFKRQSEFKQFQTFCELRPHKILKPCQTRWLSLHSCVKRILDQLNALKLYFQGEHLLDKKAKEILEGINDIHFELYLNFLDYVLPFLTTLNMLFQNEKPQIHILYSKMACSYRTILEFYIKPKYLKNTDIEKVQYRLPDNFIRPENIYVGGKCMALLGEDCKLTDTEKGVFYNNCLSFYVECAHQIFQRFPFHSKEVKCLKALAFLDPQNIKNVISIGPAAKHFEAILEINLNDLDREWRCLRNMDLDFGVELINFWKNVYNLKDGIGNIAFPLLMKLVNYLIILPHSSACVERIFSCINLNKTKIRNRLGTESLTGILHSKNILSTQRKFCYDFEITRDIIKKHNNSMFTS